MKKILLSAGVLLFIALSACNNDKNKTEPSVITEPNKTLADTLQTEVMDGHDVAMAKYGAIKRAMAKAQGVIDSIGKLPSAAKASLANYKQDVQTLLGELSSAKDGMDKWMDEFNMDSAKSDLQLRIKYLLDEKLKVNKVKEDILGSLRRADSLFR